MQDHAPFKTGDVVRSKSNPHLGELFVSDCWWVDVTWEGVPHYWRVEAGGLYAAADEFELVGRED